MRKPLIRVLATLVAAAVVVFVAVEISLRLFPEIRPSHAQDRIEQLYRIDTNVEPWWVDDDDFGYLVKPNLDDEIANMDFSYRRQTDAFGFSNAAWPDSVDIVFLGDSLLQGIGVGLERQFTTVAANGIPGASVLNLGLSGASPEHLLGFYRRFGAPAKPKIVFAVLYVVSDVDNAKHFDVWNRAGRQWGYNDFRANHYLDALASLTGEERGSGAGAGSENLSVLRRLRRTVVNSFATGQELLYLTDPVRKGIIHDVSWPDGSEVFLYTRFQSRLRAGIGNDYPSLREIFFGKLDELRDAVEADGATFVVALIPCKEEIFAHPREEGHLRLVNEVRSELDRMDMMVLDLYPAIREAAETTAPFFPHDIHFNETGNRAVGDAIANWVNAAGLLTPSD